MKPFGSIDEMISVHEKMFGQAGRTCAELVCRYVKLFDEPLESLNIRIVLAPVELGPYNRHYGYIHSSSFHFILGNRHICTFDKEGALVLRKDGWLSGVEDFIVHELTHYRQDMLLRRHGGRQSRGVHRDSGWYGAIKEAAPRYLGVEFPETVWPCQKSVRKNGHVVKIQELTRISEVEATHWPHSFRGLIAAGDHRLRNTN